MKILFCGDVHGNHRWFGTLCKLAKRHECEYVIQLGDWGFWEHDPKEKHNDMAAWHLDRFGLKGIWLDGNHENHPLLWEKYPVGDDGFALIRPNLWYSPRGNRFELDGVSYLTLGGAYSIDQDWRTPGKSWWATEMITDEEVERSIAGGKVDVMLTHDCPLGVDIPMLRGKDRYPMTAENRRQLQRVFDAVQPATLLHGHYHYRYDAFLNHRGGRCHVIGLSSDLEHDQGSWLVADVKPPEQI